MFAMFSYQINNYLLGTCFHQEVPLQMQQLPLHFDNATSKHFKSILLSMEHHAH